MTVAIRLIIIIIMIITTIVIIINILIIKMMIIAIGIVVKTIMIRFPEILVPPNHPFYFRTFHYQQSSFWGTTMNNKDT